MRRTDVTRREFQQLSAAAFGGVMAGALLGCQDSGTGGAASSSPPEAAPPAATGGETSPAGAPAGDAAASGVALLLDEPHVCRGLNTCKGKGKSGDNACAGQGTCASVVAHDCAGHNECKGQGGCGGQHGTNACKGMGGCGVPLAHGWEGVRSKFEQAMKDAGKEVGPAPAKM
jgi:hypothetical protein